LRAHFLVELGGKYSEQQTQRPAFATIAGDYGSGALPRAEAGERIHGVWVRAGEIFYGRGCGIGEATLCRAGRRSAEGEPINRRRRTSSAAPLCGPHFEQPVKSRIRTGRRVTVRATHPNVLFGRCG
jgi:hypothetical protein